MREDRCARCGSILENGACPGQKQFTVAIEEGRLSENPDAPNYAGNYMYMGNDGGKDLFKNIDTRRYDV
uniref:Uncharacterized protein n=1 Tax=viral metagenome TaxID=1070528 RepID=A0A6M3JKS7_9ZZZZ